MTPAFGDGESIRTPGPIPSAIFTSIGWYAPNAQAVSPLTSSSAAV